jgi:hypothetical protein
MASCKTVDNFDGNCDCIDEVIIILRLSLWNNLLKGNT